MATPQGILKLATSTDTSLFVDTLVDDLMLTAYSNTGRILIGAANGSNSVVPAALTIQAANTSNVVYVAGDVLPSTTMTYDLGSSNLSFRTVTASNFVGDGSGLTGVGGEVSLSNNSTDASAHYLTFVNSNVGEVSTLSVSSSNLVFVPSTGYVGIGTATPSNALDVVGFVNTSDGYKVGSNVIIDADGNLTIGSINLGDTIGGIVGDGSALTNLQADALSGVVDVEQGGTGQATLTLNKLLVGNGTAAVSTPTQLDWNSGTATLNVTGNIGIGTADPTIYKLAVEGDTYINGELIVTGNCTAYYASDQRLKKNVRLIEDPLEKIKSVRGVFYDWVDNVRELGFNPVTMSNEVGCLAQDVQAILPQATPLAPFDTLMNPETRQKTSKSGQHYLTIQYERLIPLLVESVKQLSEQVSTLTATVHELSANQSHH